MDIQKILNEYAEIATELGNDSACRLINEFLDKSMNQRYELPLIGQFSSGKSATINHLLGRDLLPMKTIETTAFATFISYSEFEYAKLEMCDGSIENISFEEIKQLDNTKVVEEGKQIKALNIGVNCDLLKSGLTFVDTPGVNTIITTHIEITERILKSAQAIIYVIPKNLTDEDILMIQTIEMQNIPVIFVRTHIDDIKKTEENWKDTVSENEKEIAEKLGHPIHFFAISNDTSRSEFEENFEVLKKYLYEEIASNVKNVFDNAIKERLEPIRKELEAAIAIRKQTLEQTAGKTIEEIEKQKSEIKPLINKWNAKLQAQQKLISDKSDETKEIVKNAICSSAEYSIKDFEKVANNSDGEISSLNIAINENLTKASAAMNAKVENLIQDSADSLCNRLGEEMISIGSELKAIGLEGDCTFDLSVARDYTERQNSIDEEYLAKVEQINEIKEAVSQQSSLSQQEKDKIQNAISIAEEEIRAYKSNVEEINNSYEPQYVERQSKLAPIGKVVGEVCDLAMLFIPAAGWTKAGSMAAKMGKSGSKLRKFGKFVQKGTKILAETDAAKDATTLLGGLKNASGKINGTMKKTSVFDYVSLSYWLEKAGETIDPSTRELDQQYENQFKTRIHQAEAELQSALEKKKMQIAALAKLNGDDWKLKQEILAAESKEKKLMRETESIKNSLESEKKKAVRESMVSQAQQEFEKRINDYKEILNRRTDDMVETVFTSIVNAADLKITNQLNSLSEQLSEIANNRDEFVLNRDQKLTHYADMISKLKISC